MKTTPYTPFAKGFFPVSNGYKLYYERYGNPKGKPVVFFHGGPGAEFNDKDKRFFNPAIWNVLLFDQRGAGRSTPFASITNNTTQHLIADTKALLNFFHIKHTLLFGGSWGATLALLFAIHYPTMVTGIIVRGTFLATKKDMDYYIGGHAKDHCPQAWETLIQLVPKNRHHDVAGYFAKQVLSNDQTLRDRYAFALAYYESAITKPFLSDKKIRKSLSTYPYLSLARLEMHYITNRCFIPENFILNNMSKIRHIPITIVHGWYDFVCPPSNATDLHNALPKSTLIFAPAGHSASEKPLERHLIKALNRFAEKE